MIKYLKTLIPFFILSALHAQDPQYSQYYANALYLSPAFAGSEENTRGIVASRYQWPGQEASYITHTASIDHYISEYKSGLGLIMRSDFISPSNLRTTDIGFVYAFQAEITERLSFRPALQISYTNKSISFDNLTFGSQYTNVGFAGGSTNENLLSQNKSYLDFSTGGILQSDDFWIGFAANHLNRPNESFLNGESRLPIKTSVFGGYKFSLTPDWKKKHTNPDKEKSISPTLLYKFQGKSDQLDVGLYGRYNTLVLGLWYRGLPIKVNKPEKSNHDALVFLIGFIYNDFNIGYSFDYTISKLTMASWGSHEITLSYRIKGLSEKKKDYQKKPVCPKF